jgi:hypothetical protein
MARLTSVLWVALASACASPSAPGPVAAPPALEAPSVAPTPPPPPFAESRVVTACVSRCTAQRQHHAIAWSAIEGECTRTCVEAASAPGIVDGASLAAARAGAIRIDGQLERVEGRARIRLGDGAIVVLPSDPGTPDGPSTLLGTWGAGALEGVSLVVPHEPAP